VHQNDEQPTRHAESPLFDIGSDIKCSIGDALWTCSSMFTSCTTKLSTKRIWVFSDDDRPAPASGPTREQALQRAADLREFGIELQGFFIERVTRPFDKQLFWAPLVLRFLGITADSDDADALVNDIVGVSAESMLTEMTSLARKRQYKKRALTHFTLQFGRAGSKEIECGVDL
jgi:ATP-dependent DNA helicase 2 subunit 1